MVLVIFVVVQVGGHRGGGVDDAECHVVIVVWSPLEVVLGLDDCFTLLIVACNEAVQLW